MPKLFILQGDRDDDAMFELCRQHDAVHANIHDLIETHAHQFGVERSRNFALGVLAGSVHSRYNIVLHDQFATNRDASSFVMLADAGGYEVEFIRLPSSNGEQLTWEDCFASN